MHKTVEARNYSLVFFKIRLIFRHSATASYPDRALCHLHYKHSTTTPIWPMNLMEVNVRPSFSNPDQSFSLDISLADAVGSRTLPTSQTYVVVYDWNASSRTFSSMCRVWQIGEVQMGQKWTMVDSYKAAFLPWLDLLSHIGWTIARRRNSFHPALGWAFS